MAPDLLLAGLAIWALGAGFDLVLGAGRRWARPVPYLAGTAGSACVLAAGVVAVVGPGATVDLGNLLQLGRTAVRLDHLAGLFLTLTGILGVAVSSCLASWCRPQGRVRGHGQGAGYLLLLGAVSVVVVAGDVFTFLFAWESLSVAFYVLTGVQRRSERGATAAWVTLGASKVSGALLLLGFLLLAGRAGTFTIAAWSGIGDGVLHSVAYALLVAGFAAKVGMAPFQVWIPIGYPAAAGPTRAAMAGLAVNVGFYGLWRILGVLGAPPTWLVAVVLLLGGITALLGIAFAAVQSDLDRVIAYSSVENAGVIMVGYGVAMAGSALSLPSLTAVGLLAATLQVIAHGVAKSALFAAAADVEAARGTSALEGLSGAGRSRPASGVTLAAGALTLAGLPPTLGFVSEWFVLEALMQQLRVHGLLLRISMAGAGALVALTAGVAALVFVRLLGFAVLGRRPAGVVTSGAPGIALAPPEGGDRQGLLGRCGLLCLAALCVGLAGAAPWLIRYVARGLDPVVAAQLTDRALRSPWVLQPVFSDFSILSPTWLLVAIPLGLAAVAGGTLLLSRGRVLRVRRVPAWHSATAGVAGPDSYSAFGYANVARHVLGNVLGHRREVTAAAPSEPTTAPPDSGTLVHLQYRSRVVEPLEAYLYRPSRAVLVSAARLARRMQSGQLGAYMAYMLVALVAILATLAALR